MILYRELNAAVFWYAEPLRKEEDKNYFLCRVEFGLFIWSRVWMFTALVRNALGVKSNTRIGSGRGSVGLIKFRQRCIASILLCGRLLWRWLFLLHSGNSVFWTTGERGPKSGKLWYIFRSLIHIKNCDAAFGWHGWWRSFILDTWNSVFWTTGDLFIE